MKTINDVELFKSGFAISANSQEDTYTEKDLEEIADNYDPLLHEAPIVIGHDSDQAWHRRLSSGNQLANGWVKELYVDSGILYGNIEVDDFTYDALKSKKLKKRSIGLYPRDSKNTPIKGEFYLRHTALLGIEPPAIKGLTDIKIYKESEEDNNMIQDKAAEWLAFALMDEGQGFNGEILEFEPEPSEENSYLFNADSNRFEGKFSDNKNQVFNFTITKDGEDWITDIKQNLEDGIDPDEDDDSEVEMSSDDSETIENTEQVNKLSSQVEELQNKLKEYEAKETKMREASTKQYCDGLYDSGRVNQDMIKADSLYQIINALETMAGTLYYSENDQTLSLASGIKTLLNNLPVAGQKETPKVYSDAVYARGGSTKIVGSGIKGATKESEKEYSSIMKYMEENKISNFGEAYRKYRKTNKK